MSMSIDDLPVAPQRIPLLGHLPAIVKDQIKLYSSLRDLGPVVKIYFGPKQMLFLNDPALINKALVTMADKFVKGLVFRKARKFFGNGILTSDGAFHLRQRRLMNPAFRQERLATYVHIMRDEVTRLIQSWEPGVTIDWERTMYNFTPYIIGKTLFRCELGHEASAEIHRSLPIILHGVVTRALLPFKVPSLPFSLKYPYELAGERLANIIDRILVSYEQDGQDHGDLLSMVLNATDPDTGERMSQQQVHDEIMTFLIAGVETVSLTLAWLFYELSRYPAIEHKVHQELDEVLAGRPVEFADLPNLPYLRRVVDETLRLNSPVTLLMRRSQVDVDLGPVVVPAGSEVMYSPLAIHRDSRFYSHPLTFDPDRWIRDPRPAAYFPFGGGRHKCIGERFAIAEIMVVAATIAAQWRLRAVPGHQLRSTAYATYRPITLPMILERRSASA